MVCLSSCYYTLILRLLKSNSYVKGYAIDWGKIKTYLGITDDQDRRIDEAMLKIMDYVDRPTHWICTARPIGPPTQCSVIVISFGYEACSPDLEVLRKKDISPPEYLEKIAEPLLSGPDVFEFVSW
jgi:hypothetical protein